MGTYFFGWVYNGWINYFSRLLWSILLFCSAADHSSHPVLRGPSPHGFSNTDLTAAAVHGQLGPADVPMRRPMRLEALPTGKPRKGKKKSNALEPL